MTTDKGTTTKKRSRSSSKKIEAVASRSIEQVSKDLLALQSTAREALAKIDGAFIEKQAELRDTLEVISEKKAELEELYGKEIIAQNMQDLEEQLEDAKRAHSRKLTALQIEFEDTKAELERAHRLAQVDEKRRIEDEARERRIKQSEEDRQRQSVLQEREDALAVRSSRLDEISEELGSFEERVKAAEGKAKGMAERAAQQQIKQLETEHRAVVSILEAKVKALDSENSELKERLKTAEKAAEMAAARTNAIAIASMDKDSGAKALDELRAVSHKQAEVRK